MKKFTLSYIALVVAMGLSLFSASAKANGGHANNVVNNTLINNGTIINNGAVGINNGFQSGYRVPCPPPINPCMSGGCYGGGGCATGMCGGGMWGWNPWMQWPYYPPFYPYRRAGGTAYKSSGGFVNVLGLVSVGWGSSQGGSVW
jgi:hypothetical protein